VTLGNAFYLALALDGWVRVDNYVDGYGVVGMVRRNPINEALYPIRGAPVKLDPDAIDADDWLRRHEVNKC
jgi:hypothetical protein